MVEEPHPEAEAKAEDEGFTQASASESSVASAKEDDRGNLINANDNDLR